MKKLKTTIITTCTDEYYDTHYLKMRKQVDTGAALQIIFTDEDRKEGVENIELTFEELPDDTNNN